MSTNPQDQEIDLSQVFKKFGAIFQSFIDVIFDFILFVKKNFIPLAILFIVGAGLGYYLDKKNSVYDHQIIVAPNFGSTDYLYSKISLLDSRNREDDSVFLKKIGVKEIDKLGKIEIEPIIDVYKFIENKNANFDLIKLMAEDGDLDKIIKSEITSKNYPFHVIKFKTKDKTITDNTVAPILNFLNDSEYYSTIQKQHVENLKIKMNANDSIILQINNLLNDFSKTTNSNQKSDKLVYYNENNNLNEIIKTKDLLVSEQGNHRMSLINSDKIIKEIAIATNIKNKEGLNGKLKLFLPIVFIFLFTCVVYFLRFYRRQIKRRNLE